MRGSRSGSGRNKGAGALIMLILWLICIILAPLVTRLLAMDKLLASVKEKAPSDDSEIEVQEEEKTDITDIDASAPEVEKFVNALILGALNLKASDIHIEPFEDPTGRDSKIYIRYRVDGMLTEANFSIPWSYRAAIIAKIKIMTNSMCRPIWYRL